MNLMFIGDIVGRGGRDAVKKIVPELRREFNLSLVIANAENSAAGNGMTAKCLADMSPTVDFFTAGDHVWDQKEFEHEISRLDNVVRPGNVSSLQPGAALRVIRNPGGGEVAIMALAGRVFMRDGMSCPFEAADRLLATIPATVKTVIVDFHAEATSEKIALSWYLDGRVTAVIGTHTHVQTNDARVLPGGTACLTDVGMVGSYRSVLGRDVAAVIDKFRSGMPRKLPVVEDDIRFDACVVSYDYRTGKATGITPVSRRLAECVFSE